MFQGHRQSERLSEKVGRGRLQSPQTSGVPLEEDAPSTGEANAPLYGDTTYYEFSTHRVLEIGQDVVPLLTAEQMPP